MALAFRATLLAQGSNRYNYPSQFGHDLDALVADIRTMLLAGSYILSSEVQEFERSFAAYTGAEYACGVNSGTDALIVTLIALGIQPGDEVITQANTFHATVAAIELAGARPVLVDADEHSYLMDIRQLPAAITDRTRVIMPVHLYGKLTPMDELLRLADEKNIHVVEDAAQAHGAISGGRRAGSFGIAGCFSFHPSKNLAAAGDAGAVVTNSHVLIQAMNRLRALGQRAQNDHVVIGLNSKLDAIQARILSYKLKYLDDWNEGRRQVAAWYRSALQDLPLSFQSESPNEEHVYHLFQIRTRQRDGLLKHLRGKGVDAVVRYPVPIHLQPAFASRGWKQGEFPVAEALARELLCLPMRPDMDQDEVAFVSSTVREFLT